jgi:hypothetical protein
MDKIASGVTAADPNALNGLMFARRQEGPGAHLASDCCLLSVCGPSAGGDAPRPLCLSLSLVTPALGDGRRFRPQIKRLKPGWFGHKARVIGLVSVQSGDQAERQYFHFAGSLALRRIARYGPKDPGLTPPGSQAETSFVFSHTHFQRTIQNGVACINDETNPLQSETPKSCSASPEFSLWCARGPSKGSPYVARSAP